MQNFRQKSLAMLLGTQFVLAALLFAAPAQAGVVTDDFLAAVSQIESSGGRRTVGDGGKAHGAWQMHSAAWSDTSAYRKRKGLPVWSFRSAHNPVVAPMYARDFLEMLENQLRDALHRAPSPEMIYAAYNVGFTRFQNLGFAIEKTPRTTRAACAKLPALLAQMESRRDVEPKLLVRAAAP